MNLSRRLSLRLKKLDMQVIHEFIRGLNIILHTIIIRRYIMP